jgi:hypothetical protein
MPMFNCTARVHVLLVHLSAESSWLEKLADYYTTSALAVMRAHVTGKDKEHRLHVPHGKPLDDSVLTAMLLASGHVRKSLPAFKTAIRKLVSGTDTLVTFSLTKGPAFTKRQAALEAA